MNTSNILANVISVAVECIILIYYSNSVMNYKYTRFRSNICIIIGYCIYCAVCVIGIPVMNITGFIIISFIILFAGFSENVKNTALKIAVLTVLMMFSELITSLFLNISIDNTVSEKWSIIENTVFTVPSKLIYCVCVLFLKQLSVSKERKQHISAGMSICLAMLPAAVCFYLSIFNRVHLQIDAQSNIRMLILSVFLFLTSFAVIFVCDRIIDKNEKIRDLQAVRYKQDIDYKSYQLIKEKYEDLKIMVHDFNKYCSNIEAMFSTDQSEALLQIQKIKNKNKELLMVEYTNNSALNIVLSQKMQECNKKNIDFQIYAQDVDLSFMDEMDIVSVFTNIIDNAIESASVSAEKKIFLNIYIMNNTFTVISIENTSDSEPNIENGQLRTGKKNKEKHGVGMLSVKKALHKYNGSFRWNYDKKECVFNTTILINREKN